LLNRSESVSDEAFFNASLVLTPAGLRSLIGYSDFARVPSSKLSYYISLAGNIYVIASILYFSLRIWMRLRTSMTLLTADKRTKGVNRMINRVAAQALVPFVFTFALFDEVLALSGVVWLGYGAQITPRLVLCIQPVVNGLASLLAVKPYRREICKLLMMVVWTKGEAGRWGQRRAASGNCESVGHRCATVAATTNL